MADFTRQEAFEQLNEIAREHNLQPSILKDVVEGETRGMSQRDIAQRFGHSETTVSKYRGILHDEMDDDDLAKLLLVLGILIGGAYILQKWFDKS